MKMEWSLPMLSISQWIISLFNFFKKKNNKIKLVILNILGFPPHIKDYYIVEVIFNVLKF